MGKFKVGPAKTRDGKDAYIFEISDKIYGKRMFQLGMYGDSWPLSGICNYDQSFADADIMPNAEILREEFEAEVRGPTGCNYGFFEIRLPVNTHFEIGDRVKVTLEAME